MLILTGRKQPDEEFPQQMLEVPGANGAYSFPWWYSGERSYCGTISILPIVVGQNQVVTVNTRGTNGTLSAFSLPSHGPVAGTIPLDPATPADTPTSVLRNSQKKNFQIFTNISKQSFLFHQCSHHLHIPYHLLLHLLSYS